MLLRTFAAKRRFNTKAARAAKRKLRSLDSNALVKQHREFIDALSDDQLFRLRILFDQYAEDLGFVRAKELRPLLAHLGDFPKDTDLQQMIRMIDADGNGFLDFEEFLTLIAIRSQHKYSSEEVLNAFKLLATEREGYIRASILKEALLQLIPTSEQEVDSLLAEAAALSSVIEPDSPAAARIWRVTSKGSFRAYTDAQVKEATTGMSSKEDIVWKPGATVSDTDEEEGSQASKGEGERKQAEKAVDKPRGDKSQGRMDGLDRTGLEDEDDFWIDYEALVALFTSI